MFIASHRSSASAARSWGGRCAGRYERGLPIRVCCVRDHRWTIIGSGAAGSVGAPIADFFPYLGRTSVQLNRVKKKTIMIKKRTTAETGRRVVGGRCSADTKRHLAKHARICKSLKKDSLLLSNYARHILIEYPYFA